MTAEPYADFSDDQLDAVGDAIIKDPNHASKHQLLAVSTAFLKRGERHELDAQALVDLMNLRFPRDPPHTIDEYR